MQCSVKKVFLKNLHNWQQKHLCRSRFFNKVENCKPKTVRSSQRRCSVKWFLKNVLKNICEWLLLHFIWKETSTQLLSGEFCKFFKNTYLAEHLQIVGSKTTVLRSLFNKVAGLTVRGFVTLLERHTSTGISLWILENIYENFFADDFAEFLQGSFSKMKFIVSYLASSKNFFQDTF